jgi:hypothetical protein
LMVIGKFITADFGRFESQVPGPRQVPWAPLYGLPSPRANPSPDALSRRFIANSPDLREHRLLQRRQLLAPSADISTLATLP